MYKVKHGLVPDCVSDIFIRKGSTHSLRNSDFVLPRYETTRYGKHSVRYLGPFLFSKLTDNQTDSPSLSVFMNKIRKLNLTDILQSIYVTRDRVILKFEPRVQIYVAVLNICCEIQKSGRNVVRFSKINSYEISFWLVLFKNMRNIRFLGVW